MNDGTNSRIVLKVSLMFVSGSEFLEVFRRVGLTRQPATTKGSGWRHRQRHNITVDLSTPRHPSHYPGPAGGRRAGPASTSRHGDGKETRAPASTSRLGDGKETRVKSPSRLPNSGLELSRVGGEGRQLNYYAEPAVAPASTTHRGDGGRHGPAGSMVRTAISSPRASRC